MTISKAEMVLQMQTNIGATGIIGSKYLMWKKMYGANRNWKDGKRYFRAALGYLKDINKLTTGKSELTANNVSNMQSTEQKFRDDMAKKLGKSFDNLTMAATAKSKTINTMAQSISKLTSSNSELTATIKKLTSRLETALTKNINSNGGGESKCPHNPDGYCFICGYKVTKRHNRKTCWQGANNPNHKKEETRKNTKGGTTENSGHRNNPNGK